MITMPGGFKWELKEEKNRNIRSRNPHTEFFIQIFCYLKSEADV